jgi:hypothetical protein
MNIGGSKRESNFESTEFTKKVGLFEAKVIAVNPDAEEYQEVLGIQLKEDSKQAEYLGEKDGNKTLRVDFWLEETKSKDKFKVTFFLENKVKENKDQTKKQYINNIGTCSWAADPNDLADWFTKREYRPAFVGEEELYNFLRTWLGNIDYRQDNAILQLEWNKLLKGNVKDLKEQVNSEWATNVVALATVKTVTKEDGDKEYQGVYNKAFLPAYSIKQFRLVDYGNSSELSKLREKKTKDLKPHERFVLNVIGEYGCKDYYTFKELKEYSSDDNLVASDKVMEDDDSDF